MASDIELDGQGYSVVPGSYQETGRTALLERQTADTPTGETDFGLGYSRAQRSWLLGEQQKFGHEWDDQKATGALRYQEGHGVDVSTDGKLTLLHPLVLSLSPGVDPTTCPMCTDRTGDYVYAFPAGVAAMEKFDGTTWTSETVTAATAPVLDCVNSSDEVWIVDSTSGGSRVRKRSSAGSWSQVTVPAAVSDAWGADAYNTATCLVFVNGEHYVITPTKVYAHEAEQIVSTYTGGSIACGFGGAVFWSDGSNRVYQYTGYSSKLLMEDLPTGSRVQSLFPGLSRLWVCGRLPDGRAMIYWYQNGQYGVGTYLEPASGSSRDIYAGAADIDHVVFADSRYGSTRHYAAAGGWSHYLEYDTPGEGLPTGTAIPYKGLCIGAGHTLIALATGDADTYGIYVDDLDHFVSQGWVIGSQIDLTMPAHKKRWSVQTVTCLPIRSGEKIKVECSIDGGRLWQGDDYISVPDDTEATFSAGDEAESSTLQYRLTLTPNGAADSAPEVTSIVQRGYPIVRSGRRFQFKINGGEVVPTRTDSKQPANTQKVIALLDPANSGRPVNFRSMTGQTYRVRVNPYTMTTNKDRTQTRVGIFLDVVLDEVEA